SLPAGILRTAGLQKCARVVVLVILNTWQREEIPTPDRLQIFFQRLTVEPVLNRDEALFQIGLIGDEKQTHIKLARFADAIGIVERTTQNEVLLGICIARICQADMRV